MRRRVGKKQLELERMSSLSKMTPQTLLLKHPTPPVLSPHEFLLLPPPLLLNHPAPPLTLDQPVLYSSDEESSLDSNFHVTVSKSKMGIMEKMCCTCQHAKHL